jgi:RsiW-degrading membrane proteinase PrsW (M82 family)
MTILLPIFSIFYYPFVALAAMLIFTFQHPLVALFATLGGLIPSLIWLFFWLQEDRLHPEPKRIILRSFIAGMFSIIFVVSIERIIYNSAPAGAFFTFLLFATVEELFKYWAAYFSCLRSKFNDEPIDSVIYLISSALGFAALENIFFLNTPLLGSNNLTSIITGNLRFIGANLLHVISSAIIGVFIAFAFYRPKWQKRLFLFMGLILAITLHALFNFSIINNTGSSLIIIFGLVWLLVIVLILTFEKIKSLRKSDS